MSRNIRRILLSLVCVFAVVSFSAAASIFGTDSVYDVRDYGAKADGKTLCTKSIQKAIDRCAAKGGGTVYLAAGSWLSGTIYMKSNVTLMLDSGCTLLGSPDPNNYPQKSPAIRSYTDNYVCQSLIAGEELDRVAIRGTGTIDGSGSAFRWKEYKNRPYVIRLVSCRDVLIEGIKLQNSPMWMQHYLACERLTIRGITVNNHGGYNNDGLDVDACRDVSISNCVIDSDDDALCFKSSLNRPCENVTVANCILSSHCNALKMGTESNGGFQNIAITNCTISSPRSSEAVCGRQRGLAGLALEVVDGGMLDRVTVSNITMSGVAVPVFVRLGDRGRAFEKGMPAPTVGTLRNVVINNIVATGASNIGCSVTGLAGHPVENISFSNIKMTFEGGGTKEDAVRQVPEKAKGYPESVMFGVLPAYGFYCRYVNGLTFSNVSLRTDKPDQRRAVIFENVENASNDCNNISEKQ